MARRCCSAASAIPSAKAGTARALGPEGAVDAFGMDDAYPIADLDDILPGLLEGRSRVYYHFGRDAEFDLKLIGWVNRVRAHGAAWARSRRTNSSSWATCCTSCACSSDRDELKLMQRAADISVQAHVAAMRAARAGHPRVRTAGRAGARVPRATMPCRPTAASSAPAPMPACCTTAPTTRARSDGDLVLIDAGAEYRGYAADITRTFPVNGRFIDGAARAARPGRRRAGGGAGAGAAGHAPTKPATRPRWRP